MRSEHQQTSTPPWMPLVRDETVVPIPPATPPEPNPQSTSESSNTTQSRVGRLVVVVDDNHDVADSLAMLMKLRGIEARVAYDGSSTLELVAADKPAVVLLDIGLPGMDGYEVCRRMRKLRLTDTRIIAMTGYGQDSDRERASEAGFDIHTVEPPKIDELLRLISEHCSRP